MYYLGKTHNLWHRMGLLLEQQALENSLSPQLKTKKDLPTIDCYEFEPNGSTSGGSSSGSTTASSSTSSSGVTSTQQQEIYDALAELYSALKEEDMWCGMWHKRGSYPETNIAIAFEQQGFYEKAQGSYELAMSKIKTEFANNTMPPLLFGELRLWEEHWIK